MVKHDGLCGLDVSFCWHHGCCQLDLGIDWPVNPLVQVDSTESLWNLHNTVILCQFLLLLGMLCHMGGWDMVAYTWSTSHITCPRSDNTHGIIDNSGVGTVGQTSSKNSDFANQILFVGGCHILGGVCQLVCLGRILQERHEKSEQPNCPTSWD